MHSRMETAMHRILPVVLFAVAALGIAACESTQTGAGVGTQAASEASPAALNYARPDNAVVDE